MRCRPPPPGRVHPRTTHATVVRFEAIAQAQLPTGTVTFLFTDIEGSTRLLHELGDRYVEVLTEHRRALREVFARNGGVEVDTQGDAFFVAFARASDALGAAEEGRDVLAGSPIRVRMGLHTGEPLVTDEGYVGIDVHRAARIAAAGHGGQILVSQSTRDLVGADSLRDLGEHRLKDLTSPERIYQLGEHEFSPLKGLNQTNLPVQPSPLIGRERELEEVLGLLDSSRLLTLTGAGGSGKTRLALQAAAERVGEFPDGVWFVSLAGLSDPDLLSQTISSVIGAKEDLVDFLQTKRLLLLLDNLEQLLPAVAPSIASLLAAASVKLLATSRERLALSAEHEYAVPTLPLDDAVALFTARARQLKPAYEPDGHVERIVARLDGLPLAVELAAARIKALTTQQIAQRLDRRFDLLTAGSRDAPPRQRTLRAAIEWSYALLIAAEKQKFARLAIFVGSFDLDAAEAVCNAELDDIQSFIDKSLLRETEGRFFMLETLREFALEQLHDSGEEEELRRAHRAYFVTLAEVKAPDLYGGRQPDAFARFAREHGNIRAAVSHALEVGEPDDIGRLIGSLWPFLITHGYLGESRDWVSAALTAQDRLSSRSLVAFLSGAGEIARFGGDLERAIEFKEALLHVEPRDSATLADLSEIAMDQGDFARARTYAEKSAAAGGRERALMSFAELALREGDLESAQAFCVDAYAGHQKGEFNYACLLEIQGETSRRLGDAHNARCLFRDGLQSFAALGDGGGVADCLEGLARIAAEAGDAERSGRLLGAAKGLRDAWGRLPIRTDAPLPSVPSSAYDDGVSMTLEEAVAYALGQGDG